MRRARRWLPLPTSKVLAKQLKKESDVVAELVVAKELGMTLGQLRREITPEELFLWHAFFQLQHDQQEEAMKKVRRRR